MDSKLIDKAKVIREGEELNIDNLKQYLKASLDFYDNDIQILQFPRGFSNLTYLLKLGEREFVLRRPPFGANIKSAHDMGREFKVLSLLQPHYSKIPQPILYCKDESIIGTPFYIMERVKGIILRNTLPKGSNFDASTMRRLSTNLIHNLADLHTIDVHKTGLIDFGKPVGYVNRQVEGWIKRYYNAQTDEIEQMDILAEWMKKNQPKDSSAALIHNDYKYDNVVLNAQKTTELLAVLDWEMATIGDPLMDLGTTLAYWVAPNESDLLKPFNLSWAEGNLNREELVEAYAAKSNLDISIDKMLFYYVFGIFKVGVIAQQIYARFKSGYTKDQRFAVMIHLVRAGAANGIKALEKNRIAQLWD